MNTIDAVYARRAVKHFDPTHRLTAEEERTLLEATIQAPTSFNIQHWRLVLLKDPEAKVAEIIRRESADAEVVLLGLATPEAGEEAEYAKRMEALSEGLPNVFFVKNASLFVGELV